MSEKRIKTIEEKMAEKTALIEKLKERIKTDTEKIKSIEKEIETLESLQIKGVIKDLELPFPEVIKLLKELKQ
ncbi:MAG: hypothetical protein GX660_03090 [Clostridiaceae bacterium]|mgnify:CR=1 FL=1|nr:hypothetical protein [Clostridiaceae bacterium]